MAADDIILTGFMGTGKSSTGKMLAKLMDRVFFDTDEEIEATEKKTIDAIFEEYGEEYFRKLEAGIIKSIIEFPRGSLVVATGGGAVLRDENSRILKERGKIVLLTASPEEILRRVANSDRPLLKNDDIEGNVEKMLLERDKTYRKLADFVVDTDNKDMEKIVFEIFNLLKEK